MYTRRIRYTLYTMYTRPSLSLGERDSLDSIAYLLHTTHHTPNHTPNTTPHTKPTKHHTPHTKPNHTPNTTHHQTTPHTPNHTNQTTHPQATVHYIRQVAAIVGRKLGEARRDHALSRLRAVTLDPEATVDTLYAEACKALLSTILFAQRVEVRRVVVE